jgi:hypothetical protein
MMLDVGENSGVGHTAYVIYHNFLWEDMDSFVG